MAGYAVTATLHGGSPRFAGWGSDASRDRSSDAVTAETWQGAVEIELVGRSLDERIADRFASIGESWSQLTFFLFDPESWR